MLNLNCGARGLVLPNLRYQTLLKRHWSSYLLDRMDGRWAGGGDEGQPEEGRKENCGWNTK